MDGTLVEEGRRLLLESGLNVDYTTGLVEGVEKIVAMVGLKQ
jgi:succinyl-CoA synthetase beta subunit